MRYAIIKNNIVENIVVADEDYAISQGWLIISEETSVDIGDTYENGVFSKLTPIVHKIVPEQIAMWQARDIMIKYNFLDDVMLFIDNIPDPVERKRAQSKFEFSNTIKRNDPLLNYVATRAGYSKSQIDDWFIEGDAL